MSSKRFFLFQSPDWNFAISTCPDIWSWCALGSKLINYGYIKILQSVEMKKIPYQCTMLHALIIINSALRHFHMDSSYSASDSTNICHNQEPDLVIIYQPSISRRHGRGGWGLTRRTWWRWRVGHWWLNGEHWRGKYSFISKLTSWLCNKWIRIVEDLKWSWKTGITWNVHETLKPTMSNTSKLRHSKHIENFM